MTSQTFKQKISAVRDFAAAALLAGGAIVYCNSNTPPDPRPAEAKNAFVDGAPIRIDWMTAAFKSEPAAQQAPVQKAAASKSAFTDEKPVRFNR